MTRSRRPTAAAPSTRRGADDERAATLVVTAARLLDAHVELLLLASDGPVRWTADRQAAAHRSRVDADAFDEAWVLGALACDGVARHRDELAVVVPGAPPLAVLRARRDAGAAFRRGDARLLGLLADRLVGPVPADVPAPVLALGDLRADTAPALALLRDSTDRLARLAVGEDGAGGVVVDRVVEELHHVERAVASLLGELALPAASRVPLPRTGSAPARPGPEWTTTGVLA